MKRIIAAASALCVALCFAGCGGQDSGSSDGSVITFRPEESRPAADITVTKSFSHGMPFKWSWRAVPQDIVKLTGTGGTGGAGGSADVEGGTSSRTWSFDVLADGEVTLYFWQEYIGGGDNDVPDRAAAYTYRCADGSAELLSEYTPDFSIILEENRSTPYRWTYFAEPSNGAKLTDDAYIVDNPDEDGSGGIHIWQFEAGSSSSFSLMFCETNGGDSGGIPESALYYEFSCINDRVSLKRVTPLTREQLEEMVDG